MRDTPRLVLVGGKPGSGKTTLARRLAERDALGLPLLDRDAIKVGLVATHGVETDENRRVIVPRSYDVFFRTIERWLREGVSLIAEHGFQPAWSEAQLRALVRLAGAVVIDCDSPDEVAARRFLARERADPWARPDRVAALAERIEGGTFDWRRWDRFDLGVPSLRVDTTEGYRPGLAEIVAFCWQGTPPRP